MVEMLVVMGIVAVLMACGLWGVRSARASGQQLLARSTANAYANAVDQFAQDHKGRYPLAAPSRDWPAASVGPVSVVLGAAHPYLRRVPESIQDGSVHFGTGGQSAATIQYRQVAGGRGYEFIVRVTGRPACSVPGGQVDSPSERVCEKR